VAITELSRVIDDLRQAALARDGEGPSDGELLEQFIRHRDETAFEALMARHGRMVLGVCRRLLGSDHDAEEAFQATFLVLARKASSVQPRDWVGNWLYGVAYRTALEARTVCAKRRARERQVDPMPEPQAAPPELWRDTEGVLDGELHRLPDKYRVAVVLCEIEGRSRKDVARQLNIPEGTLSSRLAAARKMLADRLARKGVGLTAVALGSLLAENAAAAAPSSSLVSATVKAASLFAAGKGAAGLVSPGALALSQGVLNTMFMTKIKLALVSVVTVAVLGLGSAYLLDHAAADRPAEGQAQKRDGERENGQKPRDGEGNKGAPRDGEATKKGPRDGEGGQKPGARDGEGGKKPEGDNPNKKPAEGDNPNKRPAGEKDGGKNANKQEQVTLTGVVELRKLERTRDDGSKFTLESFALLEKSGNRVQLPAPRRNEAGDLLEDHKLESFVGKQVTVSGRALMVRRGEGDNAPVQAMKLFSISEIKLATQK
jgi:RNA polymerase sigma factor (sigma-70 family)